MHICDDNICTGCCCCYNTCPKKCISMIENEFGELHPIVDDKKCISCNLCIKKCPANNSSNFSNIKKCYVSWNLDSEDRQSSASGGVATVLANKTANLGGIIYGAELDNNFNVFHSKASDKKEILKFKDSKYAQSYIGNSYSEIKKLLDEHKRVLFIGTPCQVDGLNHYLEKKYDNLITVDLICHGTPPNKYLKDYINNLKKEKNITANYVHFRTEEDLKLIVLDDKKIKYQMPYYNDLYYYGFEEAIFLRYSCYNCKYAKSERVSDITIGDFWGLGNINTFVNKIKKPSVLLINTIKGLSYFDECKSNLFYEERPVEEAVKGNGRLRQSSCKHSKSDKFRKYFKKYGFIIALQKIRLPFYMRTRNLRMMIRKAKKVVKTIINKILIRI